MAGAYNPHGLRTTDGEEIGLGPYNHNQCAFLECASCGQPITVGQRLTVLREWYLGVGMRTGRLVYVMPVDWEGEDAIVHSDCSDEFAHDHISKTPCGRGDDEVDECKFCGVQIILGTDVCAKCADNLRGS